MKNKAQQHYISVAVAARTLHDAIASGNLHDQLRQHHADMTDHDFGQYVVRLLRVLAEIE